MRVQPVIWPLFHVRQRGTLTHMPLRVRFAIRLAALAGIAALAAMEPVDGDRLTSSLRATFGTRATHEPPDVLPQPPARWSNAFAALLPESPGTPIADLEEGYELAAQFWNPVLADEAVGMRWEPVTRLWTKQGTA